MQVHLGRRSLIAAVAVASLAALVPVASAGAAPQTFVVGSEADYRQALTAASAASAGTQTIVIEADLVLDDAIDPVYSGGRPLVIEGGGHTLDPEGTSRALVVSGNGTATIRDLTVTNADDGAITGEFVFERGLVTASSGAALAGSPTVVDSRIVGNSGPGIDAGVALVRRSTISNNNGGGVLLNGGNQSTIEMSTISDNIGPGISLDSGATATIRDSLILGNRAERGGGIGIGDGGPVSVVNSTIAGNTATQQGGGINGEAELVHTTVIRNSAPLGANYASTGFSEPGGAEPDSFASVIAQPLGGGADCGFARPDAEPAPAPSGYSLDSDGTCGFDDPTDLPGRPPALGAVRDNGGPTLTAFPLAGSPLVDAIPAAVCVGALAVDQRAVARPFAGGCDIGATEQAFRISNFTDTRPWVDGALRWIGSDVNSPVLMSGHSDGTFRPAASLTRAQMVRLLHRLAGTPEAPPSSDHGLTDVPSWVDSAVRWAVDAGIMTGFGDATFRPGLTGNRAQFVRALHRLAGSPVPPTSGPGLSDSPTWAAEAIDWALGHGLMIGFPDGSFRPTQPITRGQAASVAYRLALTRPAWQNPPSAPQVMLFRG